MNFTLHIWRQENAQSPGSMVRYHAEDISPDMSLLEMLDVVNSRLIEAGEQPIAFESDCREGICGTCGFMVNGIAHGPLTAAAACQVHMRHFRDGQTLFLEPWRAKAFPIIKDLVVDRSAFDRVMHAGGYVSVSTGSAPDANDIPISKPTVEHAFDAADCIACGACVAACKNASAMLFVAAKVSHLALLPQGQPERRSRVLNMVARMDEQGFGNCTNTYDCEAVCPKLISVDFIARMNREYLAAKSSTPREPAHLSK
jgi:succinate dehydrogenase / fumarate reductase iron-sulfur subunit